MALPFQKAGDDFPLEFPPPVLDGDPIPGASVSVQVRQADGPDEGFFSGLGPLEFPGGDHRSAGQFPHRLALEAD